MSLTWRLVSVILLFVCYMFVISTTISLLNVADTMVFIGGVAGVLLETVALIFLLRLIVFKRKEHKDAQ